MKTTNLPSISSPQVCPRYKELIRTLKCCYSPKWKMGSGENEDDALKRCVMYHWSVKKEKSITNSNTRYLKEKKPEKIIHEKPKPEDCPHPEQFMYNSRIYPEAVIFKLFREFSILDLSKDAMEIDEDDEMALLNAIKKNGKHKSRKQIKREELKRQKQEVVMEKNEKKKSNSDAYSLKASAAAKHADAATRQQELESIKLAHSMGLYSNQELKNWMDKHLAKTFAAAAKSSLVVDLTSDDSDSNFNTPLKNPADKRISPAGSAASEKEGGEEINKNNQHVQTQFSPDVSSGDFIVLVKCTQRQTYVFYSIVQLQITSHKLFEMLCYIIRSWLLCSILLIKQSIWRISLRRARPKGRASTIWIQNIPLTPRSLPPPLYLARQTIYISTPTLLLIDIH